MKKIKPLRSDTLRILTSDCLKLIGGGAEVQWTAYQTCTDPPKQG